MGRLPPIAGLALCGLLTAAMLAGPSRAADEADPYGRPVETTIRAIPFDPDDPDNTSLGDLTYVSGFELQSYDKSFGGYSGLALYGDNRFLAVSDTGTWLHGTLAFSPVDGALKRIGDLRIAKMHGRNGKPFAHRRMYDAEGLAIRKDGAGYEVVVSFEHTHRLLLYSYTGDGRFTTPAQIYRGKPIPDMKANGGLEAVAFGAQQGTYLGGLEQRPGDPTSHVLLSFGPEGVTDIPLTASPPYKITDMSVGPDGAVYLLERRFEGIGRLSMQISRLPPGETWATTPPVATRLGRAHWPAAVDNMEALVTFEGPDGALDFLVMSDDNFNPLQRTLLVHLRLEADQRAALGD